MKCRDFVHMACCRDYCVPGAFEVRPRFFLPMEVVP